MKVETITPGDEEYRGVKRAFRRQIKDKTTDYDSIAIDYNALPAAGILLINLPPKLSIGNIARVLEGRGIVRDTDYRIVRVKEDAMGVRIPIHDRPVAIERKSNIKMLVRQP